MLNYYNVYMYDFQYANLRISLLVEFIHTICYLSTSDIRKNEVQYGRRQAKDGSHIEKDDAKPCVVSTFFIKQKEIKLSVIIQRLFQASHRQTLESAYDQLILADAFPHANCLERLPQSSD